MRRLTENVVWNMYSHEPVTADLIGGGYADCSSPQCDQKRYEILTSENSRGYFHGFITPDMLTLPHGNTQGTHLLQNAFLISFLETSSDHGDSGGPLYVKDNLTQKNTMIGIVHASFLYDNDTGTNYSGTNYLLNAYQGFSDIDIEFIKSVRKYPN